LEPMDGLRGYDFDRVVERRGTDSVKWSRYGKEVLPLWVADMDFPSAQPIVEVLRRRVEHGVFGYGVEPPELRGVIRDRMRRLYGWEIEEDHLVFVPGVVVGFNLVAKAVGETGDGVLIQPPVYPPFFSIGPNVGRTIQEAPLTRGEGGYEIDFDAFEAAITARTRLFLLCNPHNPVGRVFTRGELERLAEICQRHDVTICSDEIHEDFVYSGHSHIPIASLDPEIADRTITLIAPSKSFNIAGFHCAAAVAKNPALRERLRAAGAGLLPNHLGILDYAAALAAYQHGGEWLKQVVAYLEGNRDYLLRRVADDLPGVSMVKPEGTYLAWLDCRETGLDEPPVEFFLREAGVALNDGAAFGSVGRGFVRLNFGCPRSILSEALDRMSAALRGRGGRGC